MPESIRLQEQHGIQLSQKMLFSIRLLQMNTDELRSFLQRALDENPVLEFDRPTAYGAGAHGMEDPSLENMKDAHDLLESLQFYLEDQIDRRKLPTEEDILCKRVAALVDEDGYLREDVIALTRTDGEKTQKAIEIIKTLDPPGVGAKDLRECLLLQLDRLPGDYESEKQLVSKFLPEIAEKNIQKITRETGLSWERVERAITTIKQLDPRPGQGFDGGKNDEFIYPDFFIEIEDGEPVIRRNPERCMTVKLNSYYAELLRSGCSGDGEAARYLRSNMESAKLLMFQLQKREETMTACVTAVVNRQRDFFLTNGLMRPLTLRDISEDMGMSRSTISRSVNGCNILFRGRLYSLKHFFARSGSRDRAAEFSVYQIKALIREIIRNEDPACPVSDMGICTLLAGGGAEVSRRTVAKYRKEMMIPSSAKRGER